MVIPASAARRAPRSYRTGPAQRSPEAIVAVSVIAAAALATFVALLITSRPYNPMNSTVDPQSTAPSGSFVTQSSPTPLPSPTATALQSATPESAEAAGTTALPQVDDATIQAQIEEALRQDATLADLDVSTIVAGGRVTIAGSVRSTGLRQRVEEKIRSIRGVVAVDNKLVVIEATPQ